MKTLLSILILIWIILCMICVHWQWKTGEWNARAALRHAVTEIKGIFK